MSKVIQMGGFAHKAFALLAVFALVLGMIPMQTFAAAPVNTYTVSVSPATLAFNASQVTTFTVTNSASSQAELKSFSNYLPAGFAVSNLSISNAGWGVLYNSSENRIEASVSPGNPNGIAPGASISVTATITHSGSISGGRDWKICAYKNNSFNPAGGAQFDPTTCLNATVTVTPPPATTGTLTITKVIDGSQEAFTSFGYKINSGPTIPFDGDGIKTSVLSFQAYTVTEAGESNNEITIGDDTYEVEYSAGCSGTMTAAGAECVITNKLKVVTPPPSCTDGIQNQDETGVDTGGVCTPPPIPCPEGTTGTFMPDCTPIPPPIPCPEGTTGTFMPDCTPIPPPPSCTDGIQNQDETGVDTGGVCTPPPIPCPEGTTGTFMPDCEVIPPQIPCPEGTTGTFLPDCTPIPPPAPSCTDGIQNQGETGIDVGGPCTQPPAPSCQDGIQNQDETGVDVGGVCGDDNDNDPDPSCTDGILNQDEIRVDFGGVCGGDDTDEDTYKIFGYVWYDDNKNQTWDNNPNDEEVDEEGADPENELSGWTVTITNKNDNSQSFSTVTDENGYYEFDVEAGTWIITETVQDDWERTTQESHEVTVGTVTLLESLMSFIIPTAHAATISTHGAYNFGNDRNGGGGGGGNRAGIRDNDDGRVLGDSDSVEPEPLVLGEQVSAVPTGAPDAGAGGTSPKSVELFSLSSLAILGRSRKNA